MRFSEVEFLEAVICLDEAVSVRMTAVPNAGTHSTSMVTFDPSRQKGTHEAHPSHRIPRDLARLE